MNVKRLVNEMAAKAFLVIILVGFFTLPLVFAQFPIESSGSVAFTPQTQFFIPENNGSLNFAVGGAYTNATLNNGIWNFNGLYLSSSKTALPMVGGSAFSIGTQNCNVTVTRFDPLNVFPPQGTGNIEYVVSGVGNQTLNVHYGSGNVDDRWLGYEVTIDGKAKAQGDGWNILSGGWLSVNGATSIVKMSYSMHTTTFSSGSQFAIPALNGSVSFAVDGTYVFADFNGSMWKFQNLALDDTVASIHYANWGLDFSALNSNVTVTSYASNTEDDKEWVNYTVSGFGNQTLNPNYDRNGGWATNYTVYIDGVMQPQNTTWTVSDDDWLTVTGATSSVSITGIPIFPDDVKNLPPPGVTLTGSYFMFYAVALTATVIVVAAILFTFKRSRRVKAKPNQQIDHN